MMPLPSAEITSTSSDCCRLRGRGGVEGVDVDGGPAGELLDLPFADVLAGGPGDGVGGRLEGPSGRLDRRQPAQAMRVALLGEVQLAVGGIQVGVTAVAVGEALHVELPEDGGEAAMVTGLDGTMGHPVGVDNRVGALLPNGAQLEVLLEHSAQQLAAPPVELVFDLGMSQLGRLRAIQPAGDLLEALARPAEGVARLSPPAHRRVLRVRVPARRPRKATIPSCGGALELGAGLLIAGQRRFDLRHLGPGSGSGSWCGHPRCRSAPGSRGARRWHTDMTACRSGAGRWSGCHAAPMVGLGLRCTAS